MPLAHELLASQLLKDEQHVLTKAMHAYFFTQGLPRNSPVRDALDRCEGIRFEPKPLGLCLSLSLYLSAPHVDATCVLNIYVECGGLTNPKPQVRRPLFNASGLVDSLTRCSTEPRGEPFQVVFQELRLAGRQVDLILKPNRGR